MRYTFLGVTSLSSTEGASNVPNDIPEGELERRTWDVFERALDAAIAAELGDIAALELGVRVAELLMNSRVVAPPDARRSATAERAEHQQLLDPPTRFELRVGEDLATDEMSPFVELLKEGRRQLAHDTG